MTKEKGPDLVGRSFGLKQNFEHEDLTGNLTRRVKVDQKVNECSQRPPIGPNGSKFDMGGPEGSIYPYSRVRP